MQYVALGMILETALLISCLSKHQYYYKPKEGRRGIKPSTTTVQVIDDQSFTRPNSEVVDKIKENHKDPDLKYGYKRMTTELKIKGYKINHKKVYRLMKENDLLEQKPKSIPKTYAKYRILTPNNPLEVLEMDIKFVWIESQQRHAYILTILDVFTRAVLGWHVAMSITQHTVKKVFASVIVNHLQEYDILKQGIHIEIRNDNDKRFSAKSVQDFFRKNYLDQVFTHPYTPQENGHIESFHSILGRSLDRYTFYHLDHLQQSLVLFYEKYNNIRLHGSIANLPPLVFWEQWNQENIERKVLSNKKVKFKLTIPYYQISGNVNQSEASCLKSNPLNGVKTSLKTVNGAITEYQPSVQRSPSVASC